MLIEDEDIFLDKEAEFFAWCHLYELPIKQHLVLANVGIVEGYGKFLSVENLTDWYKQLVNTPGQIGALPGIVSQVDNHFDAMQPSKAEAPSPHYHAAAYWIPARTAPITWAEQRRIAMILRERYPRSPRKNENGLSRFRPNQLIIWCARDDSSACRLGTSQFLSQITLTGYVPYPSWVWTLTRRLSL